MAYKIETLPSGSKRIRIYYTDEFGKYKTKSITGKTDREVLAKAISFDDERKHAETCSGETVKSAVEKYISLKTPVLSPSTILNYKRILKNNMNQILDKSVDRLSDNAVQLWINALVAEGKSEKTIRNAYGLLVPALSLFTSYKPRVSLPQKREFIHRYPEDEEADSIIAAAKGTPIELPILLAAMGGLRLSEVRGLRWSDVQADHIIIRNARLYLDGEDVDKGTKSRAGTRILPIFQPIREALSRCEKTSEYVVPMSSNVIRKKYDSLVKSLGLPPYRFHDLRHHAASVGAKLGIPDQYMMQFIGHSTVKMLRHYQHQMSAATSTFAGALDRYYTNKDSDTNSDTN